MAQKVTNKITVIILQRFLITKMEPQDSIRVVTGYVLLVSRCYAQLDMIKKRSAETLTLLLCLNHSGTFSSHLVESSKDIDGATRRHSVEIDVNAQKGACNE